MATVVLDSGTQPRTATKRPAPGSTAADGDDDAASSIQRSLQASGSAGCMSELQAARTLFVPPGPSLLDGPFDVAELHASKRYCNSGAVASQFPRLWGRPALRFVPLHGDGKPRDGRPRSLTLGIVLSGGQAPGGHNVILGAVDFLERHHPGAWKLYGFTNGCRGIVQRQYRELHSQDLSCFRNSGGFHMIGSGRDKIESDADKRAAAECANALALDGLVVVGGDDSNTNAAVLAEYFAEVGCRTAVVGVPKTIDGDLKNDHVATSFGFDTACKVYSELVGNIMVDAASSRKYYHFVRLMGRAASHITLEVALQTHPQVALVSEEVSARGMTLRQLAGAVADVVCERAAGGVHHGVVLLPEGLVESVAELGPVLAELNELLAAQPHLSHYLEVAELLTPDSREVFCHLPVSMQLELLLDRDPHGNVQVARIETEKLLIKMVEAELDARRGAGHYTGRFAALPHYFGYEGRCGLPSNFDAAYCHNLGKAAAALVHVGGSGMMATVEALEQSAGRWVLGGTPIVNMCVIERRKGRDKPVIRKALVDLEGPVFAAFAAVRERWAARDCYRSPGPIQFGQQPLADAANLTLALEINDGEPIYIS